MRISFLSFLTILLLLSYTLHANAQTDVFTTNLSLGSSGPQVIALQKILNQDPDTRIAVTGSGSPGNETDHFGQLTKAAVIRFQEKYASEVLVPAGLTKGTGRVGSYTRAKLNTLSARTASTKNEIPSVTTPPSTPTSSLAGYTVKDKEKIDIYVGDKMLANAKDKMYSALNKELASRAISRSTATITLPTIRPTDVPSILIGVPAPKTGPSGAYVSITHSGLSTQSALYFGSTYIVRTLLKSTPESFIFVVPPIPPGLYDIAVKTGGVVSNTKMFVITDPKNPSVHLQSISPTTVPYGGILTIIGSGFTPQGNVVVTTQQKFTDVPSPDGTTLTVELAPESYREYAKIITNGEITIPMSLYVANDYGFSDEKSFTLAL
ncbi:MAG: peptidoglycan-binding domain-containing protein [Patescibacteria group bacterium]